MRSILLTSLRLTVLVLVAVAVLFAVAITGTNRAAIDALPEFMPTQVQIQTEALGLSASEVEQFITVPLEDEFNGIPYSQSLRSKSVPGLSAITITFRPGTDLYAARQLVTERVAQGPSVVNVGTPPVMLEPLSAEQRVMMVSLTSKKVPLPDLSTTAFWRIRPRVLAVPGVANVSIWGQRDVQLQVLFDPARASKVGVTLEQVLNTAGDATWTSPLSFLEASSPGADGLVDMPNQRLTVQHILPIRTANDLALVPIEDMEGGRVVRLGEVATIVQSHPALRGDAVVGDSPGLIMVIEKLPGANTLAVSKGIESVMADLGKGMPDVAIDTTVFRPATYLETALKNIGFAALIGFLLLAAWIGVATRSWRVAVIGVIAIVVPVLGTLVALYALGATFNTMTLAGIAIALGVVIDDAIVGAETVRSFVAEHAGTDGAPADPALVWEAYAEVRKPLVWALLILLLAASPLLLLTAVTGAFVQPIVVAYSLAIIASAATALVVTPVLASALLRVGKPGSTRERPGPGWSAKALDRIWPALAGQSVWAVVAIVALLAAGGAGILLAHPGGGALVPALTDRNLLVQWTATPGTSLTEMDRFTASAGNTLRSTYGVKDVASHVGQALFGDQAVNVNSAETWIRLDPNADYASSVSAIRGALGGFQGVRHTLTTYPQASLEAAPAGNGKAVSVRVYGTDPQALATSANSIRDALGSIAGLTLDAAIATTTSEPAVEIRTDVPSAASYGLKPGDVRRQTAVMIAGIAVGSYYHDQQIFDVTVWSEPTIRQNVTDIGNLPIATPSGGLVALNKIASVAIKPAPTEIDHDRASRYVDITGRVTGANLTDTVRKASDLVRTVQLPLGYHAEVTSDLADRRTADNDVWLAALGALIGVFLLLQAAVGSWSRATLVFVTLPLAAAGVLLAAAIFGAPLSLGVLIGLVLVLGVAVRNGVVLVSGIQRAEVVAAAAATGGDSSVGDAVLVGTQEAIGSILVSAVGIALLALPFAVRGNAAGMEVMGPLATVVIGGLISSTLVAVAIVPPLYLRFIFRAPSTQEQPVEGSA